MGLFSFRTRPVPGRISARVIADSINPDGQRLTTVEVTFNRYILAELNTHRMLSKNSASSRAIPVKRIMRQVWSDPAAPVSWGANQAGMQARSELAGWRRRLARRLFLLARLPALCVAWLLTRVGLHKQVVNRLLEPWAWHTVIISGTEWENFFRLRRHADAQPEFHELADRIHAAMRFSVPDRLEWGMWHQPYLQPEDWAAVAKMWRNEQQDMFPDTVFVSVARCAAVSYVRQGERRDPQRDFELSVRLRDSGHWSPFEHVAQAKPGKYGNFDGFMQLRKFYPGESGRIAMKEAA